MKKIVAILVSIMLVLSLAGATAETTLERILRTGELVVETEATYPPYEYRDDDGNFAGCDIWLAQQIADELGVTLVMVDTAFDSIIMDIEQGNGDLGIAAFTRTDDRAKVIDFSNLYETSAQLLVVHVDNKDLYSTKEALAGLKIGAQMGTVQSLLVAKVFGDDALLEMEAYGPLAMDVANGNLAGFVADAAVAEAYVASNKNLAVSAFEFTAEEASFGKAAVAQKGNEDLLEIVNRVIDRVTTDGTYQAAYDAAVAATGATGD